jgi:hypothetical protein
MGQYLKRICVPAVLILCLVQPSQASKVKVWTNSTPAHFEKAKFKQAVITSEGSLRLSRQVKPLAALDAAHVWALLEDKAGNIFVATGDQGKLFKVDAEGRTTLVYSGKDSQVLSLAQGPDGTIYAGTGPGGAILRIPGPQRQAGENPMILVSGLAQYVWSLAVDPVNGMIYAGTGPRGRIYKVTPEGKASVFYTTKQEHVLCLARGPDHMLYAGTDKGGLVYRMDAQGKGFVLYDAKQGEIHSLLVDGNGVYFGTGAPVPRGPRGLSGSSGGTALSAVEKNSSEETTATKRPGGKKKVNMRLVSGGSSSLSDDGVTSKTGAAAPPPPSPGDNSIFHIASDGAVRELFREKVMILSLLRRDGRLLAGTSMRGQLFEIDETSKEKTEIARLDHGQIQCLLARRDGSIVVGAGDPGKLYVLEDAFAAKGTIVTEVLDARIISRWGALTWKGTRPTGTAVSVAVRTGNISEPDQTWSDWSAELTDPEEARVPSPAARFLQLRITLSTDNAKTTPEVRGVTLRYKNINQAPELTALEVPDLTAANLESSKKLKIKWSAVDPNEDELTFRLYVKKEGWKDWIQVEDDLEKKEYDWDTTSFPAGFYQVKVLASDRRDNTPEEALTASRTAGPLVVAHTPPVVKLKVGGIENNRVVIEATAADPLVRLTEASFTINGKKGDTVFPQDGLFDSKTESFRFRTGTLRPGTYVLILRVRNAAGLVGSGDVVFTLREKQN